MKAPAEEKVVASTTTDIAKVICGTLLFAVAAMFMFRLGLGFVLEIFGYLPMLVAAAFTVLFLAYLAVGVARVTRRLLSNNWAQED